MGFIVTSIKCRTLWGNPEWSTQCSIVWLTKTSLVSLPGHACLYMLLGGIKSGLLLTYMYIDSEHSGIATVQHLSYLCKNYA